jgi:ubiquinone biosynthesis protein Coq4
LWSNVGNMTGPGTPRFDETHRIWHVPVLCDTERGIFPIGEIQLDEALNFVQLPSKTELGEAAQRL